MFLFQAVTQAGGVLTTLFIGLLPITIPLAAKGTWRLDRGFALGLSLVLLGLLVLNVGPLLEAGRGAPPVRGLLPLCACLAMWTWFGVANTAFVQKHPSAKVSLTNLMGLSSFVIIAAIAPFAADVPRLLHHAHFTSFLVWSVLIGFGSS